MNLNFREVQFPFTDFCILALLLGVLYSVSAFEAWLSPSGQNAAGISKMHRKAAATYAFFGILVTLLAGVVVAADTQTGDIVYLSAPLFFVVHWAMFHYRSSDLIDPRIVQDQITQNYREAVIQVLAERASTSLSVEEVRGLALESSLYVGLLEKGQPLFKSVAPVPVRDLIASLIPTQDKTRELLQSLEQEGRICVGEDGKYVMRRAAPTLVS